MSGLLDLIVAGDRESVVGAVVEVAHAHGLNAVITLLGGVQREVGRLWQGRDWSVADEHAATALADLALAAAALALPPPEPTLGAVVVTCAEEEWHVLPARMFAEQLRAYGWEVLFLGGSLPADQLTAYLAGRPIVAAGVSCSISIHLPGARRSIAAAHAAGVPVIAGGAGFGSTPARAVALGADGWASCVEDADRLARQWARAAPRLATALDDREQLALAADRRDVVAGAVAHLAGEASPVQIKDMRQDLETTLRFVEAALVTADDTVVVEFAGWLLPTRSARGVPPSAVLLGIDSLRRCLPLQHRSAARMLDLVVDHVRLSTQP